MANKVFPIDDKDSKKYTSHFMFYEEVMTCVEALNSANPETLHRSFFSVKAPTEEEASTEGIELPFNHISWNKKAIRRLLNQKGPKELFGRTGKAEGMRSYLGLHQGRITIINVAIDVDGNDIKTFAVNWGQPCPPFCQPKPTPK